MAASNTDGNHSATIPSTPIAPSNGSTTSNRHLKPLENKSAEKLKKSVLNSLGCQQMLIKGFKVGVATKNKK